MNDEATPKSGSVDSTGRFAGKCLIVVFVVLMVHRSWTRSWNQDELEAVHTSWKILQCERIYLEFFQHHHPVLYFYLLPIIALGGDQAQTILLCRLAMLPFVLGIVYLVYRIGREIFDEQIALWSSALLISSAHFCNSGIEVRPDVPQVFFGLLAFSLLCPVSNSATWRFLASGICLGISFAFLQKAVFMVPPLGMIVCLRFHNREASLKELAAWGLGILVPLVPLALWIAPWFDDYLFLNWTLNAHFKTTFSPLFDAAQIMLLQPLLVPFSLLAIFSFHWPGRRIEVVFMFVMVAASLLFVRTPYLHYWLPLVPWLSLLAASALLQLARSWRSRH